MLVNVQKDGFETISHDLRIFFDKMTIARSEDIIKDDTSILNLFKILLVSANTSVQFKQRKFE